MYRWLLDVCLAVLMVWAVTVLSSVLVRQAPRQIELQQTTAESQAPEMTIGVLRGESVSYMPLEDYLVGVLLCEIPADFHESAKQAQAVVARTYALRTAEQGRKHGIGIICDDPGCCQGYLSEQEYRQKWGVSWPVNQARAAVEATRELVVTYEGQLIDATYFACSGGKTEDAAAVWGADVPYLRSVESPGEEDSRYFVNTVTFGLDAFCARLGIGSVGDITVTEYTVGGGAAQVRVGDKLFSGTRLRDLLGLRSTSFSVTLDGDSVTFSTRGFGHRVGMSQYGADAMAESGCNFEEIIRHYYSGVEITKIN